MELKINVNGTVVIATEVEGHIYINTTPHSVNCFDSKENLVILPPCGTLVNARSVQEVVGSIDGVSLVKTRFEADTKADEFLAGLKSVASNAVVIGSIIAAQAYPGRVFGLCPVPGYERVAPSEKRMRLDQFITY